MRTLDFYFDLEDEIRALGLDPSQYDLTELLELPRVNADLVAHAQRVKEAVTAHFRDA